MMEKPLVGISSCLLGEKVRYDGGHKLDHYLRDILGRYVEFIPVCPEVECGMGVPREAVRLVSIDFEVRLMTQRTNRDMTDKMRSWMEGRLKDLAKFPLCGFIFKSRSPSSGLRGIKIHTQKGVRNDGVGMFAQAFIKLFPFVPVEDDGRLHDDWLRENFIERIFVMQRWHELLSAGESLNRLMDFHASHKYLLMAHCPKTLKQLGALLAQGKDYRKDQLYNTYLGVLSPALHKIATVKKNTNVLEHIMGYFKKDLSTDEKSELKETIDRYHDGLVPLLVPITLINHYVRKYHHPYLTHQIYLSPHPLELMLRNHV
jgi:uncharacterized protein YbgA (DUF1722 family)/uncharacterized protein YbbK (DUF523 family)